MDIQNILSELKAEFSRINHAIAALEGLFSSARSRPPKSKTAAPSKKRRTMSAAARKRISEAMKQRWAQRQNKGTTTSKKASGKKGAAPKKSSGRPPMSAEARKKLSELAKQRWAQRRNKRVVHTVEVTGSNPVAPTIRINHLRMILAFRVAPDCSNCSAMRLKSLCDRGKPIHSDRPMESRNHDIATSEAPWIAGANPSFSSERILHEPLLRLPLRFDPRKTHFSPVRLNPLLHEIPVRNSRSVRMPVGIWRELRPHIMIDHVRDQKRMHRPAIAIRINLHSQPVYGVQRLLFRRILLEGPNDRGPTHAFSRHIILPPEKLLAIRSRFSFCTPEITPLVAPAHIESLLLLPYQLTHACRLHAGRSLRS